MYKNKKILYKIYKKFPQEINPDTMSGDTSSELKIYWRPNNYRLKIPFKKVSLFKEFQTTLPPRPRVSGVNSLKSGGLRLCNYGKKAIITIDSIVLMLDKKSITAIYSLKDSKKPSKKKLFYELKAQKLEEITKKIDQKVENIKQLCIKAVKKFVSKYGGSANYDKAQFIRHEDAIHNKLMANDLIMHDTYFKKVYPDEIEFKSPAYLKNYISNRAIENVLPDLMRVLEHISLLLHNMSKKQREMDEKLQKINEIYRYK